jgi:ABC-2 type transport system ATP-binding protein
MDSGVKRRDGKADARGDDRGRGEVLVEVEGLTKRFGAETAVDDVSFRLRAGSVTGFLGPNGAGKSTTMRMLVGLTTPSSGESRILGRRYHELARPATVVGSIVDGVDHNPSRRAIDELRISAAAIGVPDARCSELLDQVGLAGAARKRVGEYSLGMRQRLGVAQALLGDPRVLLLDEPANGLDPEGINWVRALLRRLADEGRAVLVSSHLLGEVARLVDDVLVIDRGRLVAAGSVEELLARAAGAATVVVRSEDDARLAVALAAADGAHIERGSEGLRITGLDAATVGRAARDAQLALLELRTSGAGLEDVFLTLTGNGALTHDGSDAADAEGAR